MNAAPSNPCPVCEGRLFVGAPNGKSFVRCPYCRGQGTLSAALAEAYPPRHPLLQTAPASFDPPAWTTAELLVSRLTATYADAIALLVPLVDDELSGWAYKDGGWECVYCRAGEPADPLRDGPPAHLSDCPVAMARAFLDAGRPR